MTGDGCDRQGGTGILNPQHTYVVVPPFGYLEAVRMGGLHPRNRGHACDHNSSASGPAGIGQSELALEAQGYIYLPGRVTIPQSLTAAHRSDRMQTSDPLHMEDQTLRCLVPKANAREMEFH